MKKAIALVCLSLLAACAKPMEVSTITPIKPNDGSNSIDVYAKQRLTNAELPSFAGDQIVDVRTYRANSNGSKGKEFAGASCSLEARDFTAKAVSPAKIRVPVYRGQSSPLAVSCTHADFKPKLVQQAVYNHTKAQRLEAGANGGLAGVLIMAVVNEASDDRNDNYYYRNIDVVMRPLDPSKK